jgi:hypothetical protein
MRHQKPLLIVLVLTMAGTFLLNRYVFAKSASADDAKRKWEYCHLYGSSVQEGNHYKAALETATTPEGRFDEIDSNYTGVVALNRLGADGRIIL